MSKRFEKVRSRREVLVGMLRYAALGFLTTVSTVLFAKRQRLIRQGLCINRGICTGCKVLENCSLPQAASARGALAGVDND
jgi:hypothetical protein